MARRLLQITVFRRLSRKALSVAAAQPHGLAPSGRINAGDHSYRRIPAQHAPGSECLKHRTENVNRWDFEISGFHDSLLIGGV
ncbi:hypothetical protein, partial [Rhizobium sp. FKL33]|uniref:hypothetical protein n=1 Tax=Rhizobium sp. FKL33 TaxID=2562307 RepID=UPI0019811BD9